MKGKQFKPLIEDISFDHDPEEEAEADFFEDVSPEILNSEEAKLTEEEKEIICSDECLGHNPIIKSREFFTLYWLAKEIKIDFDVLLEVLRSIRLGKETYKKIYLQKANNSKRQIFIPEDNLKMVQKKINKHILSFLFKPAKNVFGFSGGSIIDAITPHLKAKSLLCVDFKDAFPTITFDDIFDYLTTGRGVWRSGWPTKIVGIDKGWFSWYGARIITELTTFKGKLPQGAPTSPRLFDLLCEPIDRALLKIADKVKGRYTRYADNIFFSIDEDEFPRPLRQAILKTIEGRRKYSSLIGHQKHVRYKGPCFDWHKLRIKKIGKNPQKLLGLNIIENKVHNTRSFKKRLRLTLHHINWLLDQNMQETREFETAWQKLQGQINFARADTLPKKLMEGYLELEGKLK